MTSSHNISVQYVSSKLPNTQSNRYYTASIASGHVFQPHFPLQQPKYEVRAVRNVHNQDF
jgi:hypothetical protein